MRLSKTQIEAIRTPLIRELGSGSAIWLFGSHTNDADRGGDIDIYVEPSKLPQANRYLLKLKLKRELERSLRNAVDLVINTGHTTAFMRQVRREGILL